MAKIIDLGNAQFKGIDLNPKSEPLTPAKLRELSGLDVSDQEAEQIIQSVRIFCKVLFEFAVARNKQQSIKEQCDNTINKAA